MAKEKKRKLSDLLKVIAIILEAISGACDKIADRFDREAGREAPESSEDSALRKSLTEEYKDD